MRTVSRTIFMFWMVVVTLGYAHADDKFFDSNSVRIRYVVEGKGEPVVLIHGFGSNIEANWGKVLKPLSESYQVIALDCRGHGKSDKPTDPKMYGREMGEDVIRLMDHLHVPKAHLVGYSMGAYIAFGLMLIHPDRILTVTMGAGGGLPDPGMPDTLKAVADSLDANKSFEPLIRTLWPPDMPPPTPDQIKLVNSMMLANRSDHDIKALAAVMRGGLGPSAVLSKDELNAKLKANTIPILGIVGSRDPTKKNLENLITRLAELTGVSATADNARVKLVIVEMGNHIDTPINPAFLKGIQDFLAAHKS
jgi:pimeloyl-ACP methyl ester carboxylesterase